MALLLMSLGDSEMCLLAKDEIVEYGGAETGKELSEPPLPIALGIGTLLDIPIEFESHAALKKRLTETTGDSWLSRKAIFHHCIKIAHTDGDPERGRFLFNEVCHRLYLHDSRFRRRLEIRFLQFCFFFPRVVHYVVERLLVIFVPVRSSAEVRVEIR